LLTLPSFPHVYVQRTYIQVGSANRNIKIKFKNSKVLMSSQGQDCRFESQKDVRSLRCCGSTAFCRTTLRRTPVCRTTLRQIFKNRHFAEPQFVELLQHQTPVRQTTLRQTTTIFCRTIFLSNEIRFCIFTVVEKM
jgi:hypothetical protein